MNQFNKDWQSDNISKQIDVCSTAGAVEQGSKLVTTLLRRNLYENTTNNMNYKIKFRLYTALMLGLFIPLPILAQEDVDSTKTENADSTKKYDLALNAYPFVFYTPETEFAAGAGGVVTFYTKKDSLLNPSNVTFSGFYSSVKTYEIFLVSNLYSLRNRMGLGQPG